MLCAWVFFCSFIKWILFLLNYIYRTAIMIYMLDRIKKSRWGTSILNLDVIKRLETQTNLILSPEEKERFGSDSQALLPYLRNIRIAGIENNSPLASNISIPGNTLRKDSHAPPQSISRIIKTPIDIGILGGDS